MKTPVRYNLDDGCGTYDVRSEKGEFIAETVKRTQKAKDRLQRLVDQANLAVDKTKRAEMAARDVLPVLKAQHDAIDRLMAIVISLDKTREWLPTKSGSIWEAR